MKGVSVSVTVPGEDLGGSNRESLQVEVKGIQKRGFGRIQKGGLEGIQEVLKHILQWKIQERKQKISGF